MSGVHAGYRQRLFRALHAEAAKRHLDHDALGDVCREKYKVHSMSEMTDAQMLGLYRYWTGKVLRTKAKLAGPEWKADPDAMVSGPEIEAIAQEYAKRGMGPQEQQNFTRRQLKGRAEIRSRRDYVRVLTPLRAMNERDGL